MPAASTALRGADTHPEAATGCLLEHGFPFADLAQLTQADRTLTDPVYNAHKWWARRPRSVIRALILAAHLPSATTGEQFWSIFGDDGYLLDGQHVGDPFSGGGTTLVESARLGANATGTDVDPLAVRIARDELSCAAELELHAASAALLGDLREQLGSLYPVSSSASQPLHYFRLRRASCPSCEQQSLLYRTPVLARDLGAAGGVVRDNRQTVVCPACCQLHHVGPTAGSFVCCHRRWDLSTGTFSRSGFHCPGCGERHSLQQLGAAALPEVLVAVEDTVDGGRRVLRRPSDDDHTAQDHARERRAALQHHLPSDSLEGIDGGRPYSYGFNTVADLFSDRQAVVLASALAWVRSSGLSDGVRTRLELAVSNAVSANNRLCGYATDYGRLAPAFTGVRSYALPILAVELNPLHPIAGRGTLAATIRRIDRSSVTRVRRSVWDGQEIAEREMAARRAVDSHVACRSADQPFPTDLGPCSAIITDPPYYDFIAYSDLSLLHRAWLQAGTEEQLGGVPIYPVGDNGHAVFAARLGQALGNASAALLPDGVIAFTYHSAHAPAWNALGAAVADAGLTITAVFPVWADARSSAAHGHPGSCEWDLVWVCRTTPAPRRELPDTIDAWLSDIGEIGAADRTSMALGLASAHHANQATKQRAAAGPAVPPQLV